jgi:hypothetical protein
MFNSSKFTLIKNDMFSQLYAYVCTNFQGHAYMNTFCFVLAISDGRHIRS